jgi:hypothetical protein
LAASRCFQGDLRVNLPINETSGFGTFSVLPVEPTMSVLAGKADLAAARMFAKMKTRTLMQQPSA